MTLFIVWLKKHNLWWMIKKKKKHSRFHRAWRETIPRHVTPDKNWSEPDVTSHLHPSDAAVTPGRPCNSAPCCAIEKRCSHLFVLCKVLIFPLQLDRHTHACMQSVLLAFSALFCSTENDTVFMFPGRCCFASAVTTELSSAAWHRAPRPSDGLGPASTEGGSK